MKKRMRRVAIFPLSKWEKDGFDVESIKEKSKPCNIRMHEVFGECYRVPLLWTGKRGAKGKETNQTWKANESKIAKKFKDVMQSLDIPDMPDNAPLDNTPPNSNDSSSDSDSSSSSSSSSGDDGKKKKDKKRKKRKSKKDKKRKRKQEKKKRKEAEKKLQEKQRVQQEKAQGLIDRRRVASANVVKDKLHDAHERLSCVLLGPEAALMPSPVLASLQGLTNKFQDALANADAVIADASAQVVLMTPKECTTLVQQAKKHENVVSHIAARARSFR